MSTAIVLDRLAEEHGHLTPELVVDAARPEHSPLHDLFEWDDSVAGERWRREQARHLIIQCRVTVQTGEDQRVSVRRYTALPINEDPSLPHRYVPTEDALRTDRDLVIAQAKTELDRLRRKYEALVDFDEVLRDVLDEHS